MNISWATGKVTISSMRNSHHDRTVAAVDILFYMRNRYISFHNYIHVCAYNTRREDRQAAQVPCVQLVTA